MILVERFIHPSEKDGNENGTSKRPLSSQLKLVLE